MNLTNESLLPRFAIQKPVTVIMTLTAFLVVGYLAFTQIAVELMPSGFVRPFLGVWVPYPNSNPEEVEDQIAKPIEEQIQTISGVRHVRTNSFDDGCWTFVEFSQGTDMDLAYSQLRDRMDRVKSELPEDVERVYVRKWSDDDDPVLWLALIQKEEIEDPYFLVEQHLQKPLERVDGVAKVEIWGAEEKSVLIHINQNLVKTYKINLYNVIEKLRQDNFAVSSGYVTEGSRKIFVRSLGKFRTLEDIQNLPIRGSDIRLKDIASVVYDVPEHRWRNKIDGKKGIAIGVFKESSANTVSLCAEVLALLNQQIQSDPRTQVFEMQILFNQGEMISESINNLQNSALWGGLFALGVIYFFLRRFRMTVIVTIAIPLSILISLTVLYFIGWTLNLITMMGLMVSVGMVVDNSIVVLENIYRKRTEGRLNQDAALFGASEVSLAVTMATLTTIVVFLPLILMNDEIGFRFYMLRIGLPVIISLLASLMVAMIFIPLAATRILSQKTVKEPKVIHLTNQFYGRILQWVLTHRIESFVIFVAIIASMFFAASKAKYKSGMQGNINDFGLFFDLPENYTLDDVERVIQATEDSVMAKKDRYGVKTINSRYSHDWARVRVFLLPAEDTEWYSSIVNGARLVFGNPRPKVLNRDEVIEDLNKRLPQFPGVKIRQGWHQDSGGEDASLTLSLYGDDTNRLALLSKEVERRLSLIDEIISVETDRERGSDEIRLQIKRDQAKKYGISPSMISGTIQYALRGIPLPKYHTAEKEIDIHIQLREDDRKNLHQLKNLTFFTQQGKEVPLDALVNIYVQKGFGEIHRENGKTYLSVKANTTKDNLKVLFEKVDAAMKDFKMPYGYSWTKGREFQNMQESSENQLFALILSGTFVFLLMGVLFESFVLPLSVILAIPFSFVGAYWLMYLTGTPIDTMSQIGFVILVGVVVNNAIVLIDLINRLRYEGIPRYEAIIQAGAQRFRPILMTAFTTIGGLVPMALGKSSMMGNSYAPMGRTIIGGLLTSTILSLVAVPWAYTLFDDMRNYFMKIAAVHWIRSRPSTEAPETGFAKIN